MENSKKREKRSLMERKELREGNAYEVSYVECVLFFAISSKDIKRGNGDALGQNCSILSPRFFVLSPRFFGLV